MSTNKYVLAKDEDFEKLGSTTFIYIGIEPYVEIPHVIQGVSITSYYSMFRKHSGIQGVKSTNKNITCVDRMFCGYVEKEVGALDLTELDMTGVESATDMFIRASFTEIIWPKDKMPTNLKKIKDMFYGLIISTLDLSAFDFTKIIDSKDFLWEIEADKIIFPTKGLLQLLAAYDPICQEPLYEIDQKYHTEELCWAAILVDKINIKHVKIKSKRILMYLGSECPEYVKFYYGD